MQFRSRASGLYEGVAKSIGLKQVNQRALESLWKIWVNRFDAGLHRMSTLVYLGRTQEAGLCGWHIEALLQPDFVTLW